MSVAPARLHRDGTRLCLTGRLDRSAVPALWPAALAAAAGASTLDLTKTDSVDSAGLAMLVALADHMGQPALEGAPHGLEELRIAYRLTGALRFDAQR